LRWPLIQRALRVFSSPALAPDSIPGSTRFRKSNEMRLFFFE